jgi:hypothetical protein
MPKAKAPADYGPIQLQVAWNLTLRLTPGGPCVPGNSCILLS